MSTLPALPSHPRVVGGVLDLVGDTPLFEIRRLETGSPRARVYAKAEQQNPGGTVKGASLWPSPLRSKSDRAQLWVS